MKVAGKSLRCHRLALHLWKGMPIDSPAFGAHECDTPACFNPDHLREATPDENERDRWVRERIARNHKGRYTKKESSTSDLPF